MTETQEETTPLDVPSTEPGPVGPPSDPDGPVDPEPDDGDGDAA